jgi:hypothetical protein
MNARGSEGVWAEMARRKLLFHPDEEWKDIRLWGLFAWEDVEPLLRRGLLLTDMRKDNRTIWCWPSAEAYKQYIEPLLTSKTIDELTMLAGWK